MNKHEIFFDTYIAACNNAYDRYLDAVDDDMSKDDFEPDDDLLEEYTTEAVKAWEASSLTDLEGLTPIDFMEQCNELKEMLEMFRTGAAKCFDKMPEIFLDKLKTFEKAEEEIIAIMENTNPDIDYASGMILQFAVEALGSWKSERAIKPLIGLLYKEMNEPDLIYELVRDALVNIEMPAVPLLMEKLEEKHSKDSVTEYLMMALSDIGEYNRSEDIYKCLKNTFLKMDSKAIGAICLANYGDGRAIPSMRGYLEKNKGKIDKLEFQNIVSSIKRLGGQVEDLKL